ncbi:hypothetical protein SARC_11739 [Sphaeroforma arctica JP610]|uniref:Uncharacterized protein n=1 Tax=Sphaeroforma arctica JP610 TaxID=667725 RepID=A0A0L0FI85_9EUKA|nr:hypothetical protein SARC_11739 [Sphaeroforma arctica JP610]KNC75743.1 hypothetical protein SARC_11739 [Sphaeroforma arctica JP610]|eukprot:XP_014149645.1 hypothetical protein SARC_11739 [Sphaeroforma arctica JP610]
MVQAKVMAEYVKNMIRFLEYWRPEKNWNEEYPDTQMIPYSELIDILPSDVCDYFNKLAYGTEDPGPEEFSTQRRKASLEFLISKYMPRKRLEWDPVEMKGNPTRSGEVNDLLKAIERFETRAGYMVYDATNITYINLKYNENHPDEVFLEITRSKNIAKKSQVSRQVVLGSLDPYLCALSALTAHIIDRLRGRSTFSNLDLGYMFTSTGSTGRDEKLRTDVSRSKIKNIISAKGEISKLGTHSMRECVISRASTLDSML